MPLWAKTCRARRRPTGTKAPFYLDKLPFICCFWVNFALSLRLILVSFPRPDAVACPFLHPHHRPLRRDHTRKQHIHPNCTKNHQKTPL